MSFTCCVGDDDHAIRGHLAALLGPDGPSDVVDGAGDRPDRLVDIVSTPSLFAPTRRILVDHGDLLPVDAAAKLRPAAEDVLALRARGPVPPALRAKLTAAGCDVHTHALPTGRGLPGRVAAIGSDFGVTLSPAARSLIASRCADLPARIATVCELLAGVGLTHPTTEQVGVLLGPLTSSVTPWQVSDAVEAGLLEAALAEAERVEPVPLLIWLASRAVVIARARELFALGEPVTSAAVVSALKLPHAGAAKGLLGLLRHLDVDDAHSAVIVTADAYARALGGSARPADVIGVTLGRLHQLYRPGGSAGTAPGV